ncbi:MAG: hypothetical protein AAB573_01420 [Patescibacteria group bacterium]
MSEGKKWQCNVGTTGAASKEPFTCTKQPTQFYRNIGDRCVPHAPKSGGARDGQVDCGWQSPSGWIGRACDNKTKTTFRVKDADGDREWSNIWGNGPKCKDHSPIVIKGPKEQRRQHMFWFRRKELN